MNAEGMPRADMICSKRDACGSLEVGRQSNVEKMMQRWGQPHVLYKNKRLIEFLVDYCFRIFMIQLFFLPLHADSVKALMRGWVCLCGLNLALANYSKMFEKLGGWQNYISE